MTPPEPLALDDIMLLDDDDDELGVDGNMKLADIQETLQKQAELIRDLMVQRDYLIIQILQERGRWQAERDGWDRTSEALIARYSRKDAGSAKDEELAHRCAVYESDNKYLKEKVHDTQVRLADLEAELHRLKPLLAIQSFPSHSQRQEPTQMPHRHARYMSSSGHVPPFTSTTPHAPFISYSTFSSYDANHKRKRDGPPSIKGKEKDAASLDVDANADDDSDNTDAPLTPTPTLSTSHNPYAYMNNLYRHVLSPSNALATSPATPKPKPPGALNSTSLGNSSNAMSHNHYTAAYSPYPFSTTTLPKQPSSSTVGGPRSTPSRQDEVNKDSSRVEANVGIHNAGQEKGKATPASSRKTASVSTRQQAKYKTGSMLGDARVEHLLLAARKIGRGRAITMAGLAKAQELVTEESKPKTREVRESAHGNVLGSRSTQRRRATGINSPTTPTPRRVHGNVQPLTEVPSLAVTPGASRTREVLFGSAKTSRNRSSIPDMSASLANTGKDDEGMPGSGQTPLDSLLSAARTMMSEDRGSGPTAAGQSITSNAVSEINRDTAGLEPSGESPGEPEGAHRRKRRRESTSRTVTPRTHTTERLGAMPSGARTKSALDVLADQAAAAVVGGSTTRQEMDRTGNCDDNGPLTSDSYTETSAVDPGGPVNTSAIHELVVAHTEEPTSAAAEAVMPRQIEASIESKANNSFGTGFGTGERRAMRSLHQPGPADEGATEDQVSVEDRTITRVEGPSASSAGSGSSSSDSAQDNDWDPFGGMPNIVATADSGGISEGDLDAEGDIDPDSQEMILDAPHDK